jgi:type I restriction enzyme M protein
MFSKRDVLAHLSRDELLTAAGRFDLAVADRRAKDQLVDAVSSSRRAGLADILGGLSRDRLKELCRALGLDDAGKERLALVERLAGESKTALTAAKGNRAT